MRKLFAWIGFFRRDRKDTPIITMRSSLEDILRIHPHATEFLRQRYGVIPTERERHLPLEKFCRRLALPPPQILYMQIQMEVRERGITRLTARAAETLLRRPETRVLDVREEWETKLATLPRAERLSERLLEEMQERWPKETPLLVYCHHGVRSADAASFLAEIGFSRVHVLEGGIDGWSVNIDATVPRYEGNPC